MTWIGPGLVAGSKSLSLAFVVCMVLAGFAGMPVPANAAAAPVVNSESVSHISEHGATLEAQIDPNGLETKYEFWLQYNSCQSSPGSCDTLIVAPVSEGYIAATGTSVHVTASLTGLQAGYTYTYFVYAVNSDGWLKGESREFVATSDGGGSLKTEPEPLPTPDNKARPYESTIEPGIELWAAEAARRGAEYQHEQEEREARERQTTESAKKTSVVMCHVPMLKGDSLAHARTALIRNHCRVGHVTRPRRSRGRLIVVAQSHPHGATLPKGSRVALRLVS